MGLPRPADRMEDRGTLPRRGQEQGRGAHRPIPPRVPRVRGALDRRAARGIQAPGRDRRLAEPLFDHELRRRSPDRARDRQVPDGRLALQGCQAGHVVGGGKNRAGRGRGRIPRPRLADDLRALSRRRRAGAVPERRRRHLDNDALDHSRQPRHRLWGRHRISRDQGRRDQARQPGQGRRQAADRRRAPTSVHGKHRHREARDRLGRHGREAGRPRLRPSVPRPRLRLRRAPPGGGFRGYGNRHRLRPHRARSRRRRLGTRSA